MFDMDVARCAPYMEHDGSFNMLHAVVAYMDQFQKGLGAVAVSPRCGVGWWGRRHCPVNAPRSGVAMAGGMMEAAKPRCMPGLPLLCCLLPPPCLTK